jgi:hypothetical protein
VLVQAIAALLLSGVNDEQCRTNTITMANGKLKNEKQAPLSDRLEPQDLV